MKHSLMSVQTTLNFLLGHLIMFSGLSFCTLNVFAGDRAIDLEGSRLRVYSDAGSALQLHFERDDMLRIWFKSNGHFERESSLLRVDLPAASVAVEFSETADAAKFRSSRLLVEITKRDLQLAIYNHEGQLLHKSRGQTERSPQYLWQLADEEHIFGLGQDNDAYRGSMDRRGKERDLWSNQEIRRGHVTADIPIPFLLSTGPQGQGYGLFFDTSYRSRFDLGAARRDEASWQAPGGELDLYFIQGPSFAHVLDRYTELTGRPSMPPLWALGFIQSKCTYWNWAEIDDVVHNLRTRQIPMDVMVIDYDWARVPMDFQWADRWEGKSREKIQAYEQQGTRFLISNAGPMLRKDASNYEDAKARGLLATDGQGNPITVGHYGGDLMDFTHPEMQSWLWPQLEPLYQDGIDGWWLDLTEPEGEPEQTQYYGGGRDKIHNQFALLNSKAYYEMQLRHHPNDRVFILTRTGTSGIQRYASAIWTGDIFSDYETLAAHVPEALNTGLSGIPYWTQDSGGFIEGLYKGNLEDHGQLYERWLQFASFSAITRSHKVGPSAPYMFGPKVEASSRHYLQQRYRLLPYIYSLSWEAHSRGLPLM
jgi:alpha-glucosidase